LIGVGFGNVGIDFCLDEVDWLMVEDQKEMAVGLLILSLTTSRLCRACTFFIV
jgi:hypothetical protein